MCSPFSYKWIWHEDNIQSLDVLFVDADGRAICSWGPSRNSDARTIIRRGRLAWLVAQSGDYIEFSRIDETQHNYEPNIIVDSVDRREGESTMGDGQRAENHAIMYLIYNISQLHILDKLDARKWCHPSLYLFIHIFIIHTCYVYYI